MTQKSFLRSLIALSVGGCSLILVAQPSLPNPALRTKDTAQNSIKKFGQFEMTFAAKPFHISAKDLEHTTFMVTQVKGTSGAQGLTFAADKFTGTLYSIITKTTTTTLLQEGHLTGNVSVTSDQNKNGKASSVTFTGPVVDLAETAKALTVTAPNRVTITSKGSDPKTKSRDVSITGNTGTAELEPFSSKADQRLHSGSVDGDVVIDIDTVQLQKYHDDPAGPEKIREVKIKGHGTAHKASVVVSQEGGTLYTFTISGDVVLDVTESSDTLLVGHTTFDKFTVVTNDQMEVLEWEGGAE